MFREIDRAYESVRLENFDASTPLANELQQISLCNRLDAVTNVQQAHGLRVVEHLRTASASALVSLLVDSLGLVRAVSLLSSVSVQRGLVCCGFFFVFFLVGVA